MKFVHKGQHSAIMASKFKIFLIVSCSLLLAIIVWWLDSLYIAPTPHGSVCNLDEYASCSFEVAQGQSLKLISYQTQFLLEQSNKLSLQVINANKLNSEELDIQAYLIGVNMNMGRIPLSIVKQDEQYQIEVIPVMCTEQNMQWKIQFMFGNHQLNLNKPQSFFASFSTHW